jgi:citrate lyase subunit beta/citryl-CoA lyase
MSEVRLRRSVLFMPGANASMLEKARGLACDVVILDLEDAVAPEAKESARAQVCAAVKERQFGHREVAVRINPLSSPWGDADLTAVRDAGPDAILLPKVMDAGDIAAVRDDEIPLWAMIETAQAMLNLAAIAASGVSLLAMGCNDLLKEMGAAAMPARENLWGALTQAVIAARANGIGVIDGTFNTIGDAAGLAASCEQGKAFGFDGKTLIHPSQIESCNRIFAPSPEAIAEAHRIVAAFARPENSNKGAISLEGRMVERLHADSAAQLIALADAIAARNGA